MKVSIFLGLTAFAAIVQAGAASSAAAESELIVIVTPYLTAPAKRNSKTAIRGFGKFSVKKRSARRFRIKSYRRRDHGLRRRRFR